MTDYLQVWHARVPEGSVEKLLDLRPDAIAEAKRLCPELRAANLVRLEDGTWLDVLRWSCPDGEERLLRDAEHFDALHKMHELLENAVQVGRGEILPEAGRWAGPRTPMLSTSSPDEPLTGTATR